MQGYTPGVCNIGKNEIRKRYASAVVGFVITAIVVYIILLYGWPHWVLLSSFIPLVIGFEGLYQGYHHFCAGFAARGIYDLSGSGGTRNKVTDQEAHNIDMRKANQIHMYSILSSLILVAFIYSIF